MQYAYIIDGVAGLQALPVLTPLLGKIHQFWTQNHKLP